MIIKIKSRKKPTYRQLLEYILNEKAVAKNGFVITHNLRGKNINEWIEEYKQNENYRQRKRSDSVYIFHEILSWHKDEKNISLEKMRDMAEQYIQLRNPNGMYVATAHTDKQHYHIHICASGIEYRTGKSLRLEKKNLQQLKKNIQQYQIEKYPELSKSIVNYEKSAKKAHALSDKAYQVKLRTGRATEKENLTGMLENIYKKAISKKDFFDKLKLSGLRIYSRNGIVTGLWFENKKFRLKRIGFSEERLEELNKSLQREKELNAARKKSKEKIINLNR